MKKLLSSTTWLRLTCIPLLLFLASCTSSPDYPGPVHGERFNGLIDSLDLQKNKLSVSQFGADAPVVFSWNQNTKWWKQGVPIRPDEVAVNWPVRVHYHREATNLVAHHVYILLSNPNIH